MRLKCLSDEESINGLGNPPPAPRNNIYYDVTQLCGCDILLKVDQRGCSSIYKRRNPIGRHSEEDLMAGEKLYLHITHSERTNSFGTFRPYDNHFGLPTLSRTTVPYDHFAGPYVAIRYRLGIVQGPNDEIWNCEMAPTADGFSINNEEFFIRVLISQPGLIFTKVQDHNFQMLYGFTGVVTLLLPSTRPQMFQHIAQLYSVNQAYNTCVSCIHQRISVPGPRLDEYQEGPVIEYPIKKLRPGGMWANKVGLTIIKYFQRLADDGKRNDFIKAMQRLENLADCQDRHDPQFIDLVPLVLYELAMLDLHENRIEQVKRHMKKAMEISRNYHSPNHRFLQAKKKYVESVLVRRKGDYAKAKEILDESVEILLPCAAGEETAENRYFTASYFVEKSARVGITDNEEAMAERCFQDVERHLNAETRPITNRFQIRRRNRQLALYVKSSRHAKNLDVQRSVSEQHMTKAFQLIEEIERSLLMFYPKKALLIFDIVKSDYFIRIGNFERGIAPSEEALMIAKEKHWLEYEEVALQRLQICSGSGRQQRQTFV